MSAQIISLQPHRPDQPDAIERAWEAFLPAFRKAQAKANIDNMAAAVDAYRAWRNLFLADEEASGGPADER